MHFFKTILLFINNKEYRNLLFVTSLIILLGTVAYHYIEGWTWIDAAYFYVITLATIGYGDFYPTTDLGKLFTIGYIILGVGIIIGFINTVYIHFKEENKNRR